jgi:hypothetical protein
MTIEIGPLTATPSFLDHEDSQPISPLEAVDLDCSNYSRIHA